MTRFAPGVVDAIRALNQIWLAPAGTIAEQSSRCGSPSAVRSVSIQSGAAINPLFTMIVPLGANRPKMLPIFLFYPSSLYQPKIVERVSPAAGMFVGVTRTLSVLKSSE